MLFVHQYQMSEFSGPWLETKLSLSAVVIGGTGP